MSEERTFIAIKPDGVQRGLVGEIIKRFEVKGFKLVAMKFLQASEDHLKKHYADLSDKPFFAGLVKYMASGPLVAMCYEGPGVVKTARQMMGETKPADSKPGTIRGDFCIEVGRNIIHGSDSVESANKEISLWFKPEELVSYKQATHDWIYEMVYLLSDLTTEEGLMKLNEYLKDKSYMQGYCLSQSDIAVYISINRSLDHNLYPHLYRWHKHINVVGEDITKSPSFRKQETQVCKIKKGSKSYKSPKKEMVKKTEKSRTKSQDSFVDNSDLVSEKELRNIKDDKDYDSQVYPTEISNIYTILLEIKPKDEEVDMKELESLVRGVDLDGLKWGASQTTPIAYGVHKLSIICTLEDDRSSMQDVLQRLIKYEDYVRDVNIAAFNKL